MRPPDGYHRANAYKARAALKVGATMPVLKGLGYDPTEKWETGMKDAIGKVKAAAAHDGAGK